MNDGMFPKENRQEGYLNDRDRILLAEAGITLAKTSLDAIYENQFNIYRTLTIPEEKLFLSYSSSDKEGKCAGHNPVPLFSSLLPLICLETTSSFS